VKGARAMVFRIQPHEGRDYVFEGDGFAAGTVGATSVRSGALEDMAAAPRYETTVPA
jgi:hypothetical protein